MARLAHSEFMPYAPSAVNDQVHINHDECPAGVDSKRRLYIKRTSSNTVVAFCHHCGGKGSHTEGMKPEDVKRLRAKLDGIKEEEAVPLAKGAVLELPTDIKESWHDWPADLLAWIAKSGLSPSDTAKLGIGYSQSSGGLIISGGMWANAGTPLMKQTFNQKDFGYQVRHDKATAESFGRRYTTYAGECGNECYMCNGHPTFFVEDVLSAYKIAKAGGEAFACYGLYSKHFDHSQEAVVFFDDDGKAARDAALTIVKLRSSKGQITKIHRSGGRDPKEHTLDELKAIIDYYDKEFKK